MAFEDLSIFRTREPKIPRSGDGRRDTGESLSTILGLAHVKLEDLPYEPEAKKAGWQRLALKTTLTFYDPEMARELASRHNGEKLGPISKLLQEKVGIDTDRMWVAKRIGLKYVAEDPEVDISWLPDFITAPKNAFVTLAREGDSDFTAEVRNEMVTKREHDRTTGDYISNRGLATFFDNGHPDLGESVPASTAVSHEDLSALSELYARFREASHALIAAAVSDNFSITPPTPNELWTPN